MKFRGQQVQISKFSPSRVTQDMLNFFCNELGQHIEMTTVFIGGWSCRHPVLPYTRIPNFRKESRHSA